MQARLVRLTVLDGSLVLDVARRYGGRGAYLHVDPACWKAFVHGKGYVRSLRRRVTSAERQLLDMALVVMFDKEESAPNHGG